MDQKAITIIQNDRRVTRKQAIQIFYDENPNCRNLNYAKAVKSATKSTPTDNICVQLTQNTTMTPKSLSSTNNTATSPATALVTEAGAPNNESTSAQESTAMDAASVDYEERSKNPKSKRPRDDDSSDDDRGIRDTLSPRSKKVSGTPLTTARLDQNVERVLTVLTATTPSENQSEVFNPQLTCPTPEHLTSENDHRLREDALKIFNEELIPQKTDLPFIALDANISTTTTQPIIMFKKPSKEEKRARSRSKHKDRTPSSSSSYKSTHSRERSESRRSCSTESGRSCERSRSRTPAPH
jgi:hypothetical protein